jgi:hypothetical protein
MFPEAVLKAKEQSPSFPRSPRLREGDNLFYFDHSFFVNIVFFMGKLKNLRKSRINKKSDCLGCGRPKSCPLKQSDFYARDIPNFGYP